MRFSVGLGLSLALLAGCGNDTEGSARETSRVTPTLIAFSHVSEPYSSPDSLAVIKTDGSGYRLLPTDYSPVGAAKLARPTWSPNGKQIAFVRWDGEGTGLPREIAVIDTDGKNLRLFHREPRAAVEGPSWSPDGREMAFVRWLTSRPKERSIVLRLADGSTRRLTLGHCDTHPSWAPDGRTIAFVRRGACEGADVPTLSLVNRGGPDVRSLGPGDAPDWSPDGTKILVQAQGDGDPEYADDLWAVNADGSGRTLLTDGASIDGRTPAWSPDGTKIVFVSSRTDSDEIWVMDADGGSPRQVTKLEEFLELVNPDWQPAPAR